ncbi:MDN1 [Branchiostoma lanceolatum]|uniref:Midasin n=1 Tax=Branchiostoma lanceolatum TaxID=7740 RepID=A0A8J9W2Q4_BRALA|nr:MDN1 [Branchiostoma lanceolatum]
MDKIEIDLRRCLRDLQREGGKCEQVAVKLLKEGSSTKTALSSLSKLLLDSEGFLPVARCFRPLLLELLERAAATIRAGVDTPLPQHEKLCAAIGRLTLLYPDVLRFAERYFSWAPSPFQRLASKAEEGEPVRKKKKRSSQVQDEESADVCKTCFLLLWSGADVFCTRWGWGVVLSLLGNKHLETRWWAAQCTILALSLTEAQKVDLLNQHFTPQQQIQMILQMDRLTDVSLEQAKLMTAPGRVETSDELLVPKRTAVVTGDLSESVVSVCGILLPTRPGCKEKEMSKTLVPVPSTLRNLHCLAMAVLSQKAVLLEGPVGCGKTALVKHLANLTGHSGAPYLLKVQLGDQTDSKALLGTYRCTDVPGEFVWQPGVLTQAVTNGNWILLEDIDYAPMDVISVLVPLLESRKLSIPGHGETVRCAPDFQLFASQQLLSSATGYFKQHSSNSSLLDRLWTRICVEPLSREELLKVLVTKHPNLSGISEKLLDVYCMLSSGRHDMAVAKDDGMDCSSAPEDSGTVSTTSLASVDGRLISTRDLLKWCDRIEADFRDTSLGHASSVFQESLDCFCSSLAKPAQRLRMAEVIGARLNISREKAVFYSAKYKPNIDINPSSMTVGRATIPRKLRDVATMHIGGNSCFAHTRHAVSLLERVAVCVQRGEPVLLVGETGTGKTSSVQYLSTQTGHTLKVVNMNQQSDSNDLLGGFKPVDVRLLVMPIREEFEAVFCETFSRSQNAQFLGHVADCFTKRRWQDLLKLMLHCQKMGLKRLGEPQEGEKKDLVDQWKKLAERLAQLQYQLKTAESALAFSFIEGTLVQAVRKGEWVLLDEINLATAETLECLSGLLESVSGSVVLIDRGDTEPVTRHPDFRLFACMNPATDVGKKDLPPGIRSRFTEFYVDELEEVSDLKVLVHYYLQGIGVTAAQVDGIIRFYLNVRKEAAKNLTDTTGHRPHYSLRTLCRALRHAAGNPAGSTLRSLYEGFCLSFLSQLDRASHPVVEKMVCDHIVGKKNIKGVLKQPLPRPEKGRHAQFEGYWITQGGKELVTSQEYVLTPAVRANLRDLARIVSARRYPVLLQGETSVGKTSLITWLAQASGNHCVRINNHEHTDIQEYVGCYAADHTGKLVFKEGVLVEAMRKGHWIILDELNLAPTDVLEALNRLLDDNRELYIAETQETVKAHPHFMLFATQNPPGLYGGRKVLSRAFRDRFVELHFDEIPARELETILEQRCNLPQSYCKKLVKVMQDLQAHRRSTSVFAGKHGFITLRDLFRWAERYRRASQGAEGFYDWDQHLADDGYMLLAGRVRRPEECDVIRTILEKHLRRKVDPARLFSLGKDTSQVAAGILKQVSMATPDGFSHVVWTYNMRRLAVLIGQALKFGEAVLLVGETGCGKTTLCQLYAVLSDQQLLGVNCHMHTETADFLGGLRPVRHRSSEEDSQKLFEWVDGPLVQSMKEAAMFLIDEISLADDSVLERLNSVLEPGRSLVLAEKGGSGEGDATDVENIVAQENFRIVATMNPGGDFGKKELSPALRNRFTEIWCPSTYDPTDLVQIIEHNLSDGLQLCNQEDGTSGFGHAMMEFIAWFCEQDFGCRYVVSIRDILSWVSFINTSSATTVAMETVAMETEMHQRLDPALAYIHGACLVYVDGLGSGSVSVAWDPQGAQKQCVEFLCAQVERNTGVEVNKDQLFLVEGDERRKPQIVSTADSFGILPFTIPRGPVADSQLTSYALHASTTALNAQRVLRALQLPRPVLLEGSPGVGKTSLVAAIAKASEHELVRINLSEQTDVSDLFGADLPVEGGVGGQFAWRDGPLLSALKAGNWVVLDELNLASQSVLEGLNACFDHRGEVFVPELGRSFHVQHNKTKFFACQNPLTQGGGRKGLPRSFLNRFTQVYVEPLSFSDLHFILCTMFPTLDKVMLSNMVTFNQQLYQDTVVKGHWGQQGGPWEFNLRDLFRWCELIMANQAPGMWDPGEHVGLIYSARMRSAKDKDATLNLYRKVMHVDEMAPGQGLPYDCSRLFHLTPYSLQVGHSVLLRCLSGLHTSASPSCSLQLLHQALGALEDLMMCIKMNWMAILVGPHSCGKTSLVQLLSQLTGHQLQVLPVNSSMDTTELLGGFEQADICRPWEKLVSVAMEMVKDTARRLVLETKGQRLKATQDAAGLLKMWDKFKKQCETGSMEEGESNNNSSLTLEKFTAFEQLLSYLEGIQGQHGYSTDDLAVQQAGLQELKAKFERLSTGTDSKGTFEWIDSVLVQALQTGEWLLVDNVNFCSPSVLDRLNALLEPEGVLSISERGVIDGQVPVIKPHPDFRLILAMDPVHGEISRAMRNRGVEIYMTGEQDRYGNHGDHHGNLDPEDVMSLLQGVGLVDEGACQQLVRVHQEVREQVKGPESCSVPELLQAAVLTVQELQQGTGLSAALLQASTQVYVSTQRTLSNRQLAQSIIEKHLSPDGPTTDSGEEMCTDMAPLLRTHKLPSAAELSACTSLSTIKRQGAVLVGLFQELSSVLEKGFDSSLDDKTMQGLVYFGVKCFLETASHSDWEVRLQWLQEQLQTNVSKQQYPKKSWEFQLLKSLESDAQFTFAALQDVFRHPLMHDLVECSKVILSNMADHKNLQCYSYDIRWNMQFLQHVLNSAVRQGYDKVTLEGRCKELFSLANRLQLVSQHRRQRKEEDFVLEAVLKPKSALDMSVAVHKGTLTVDALPNTAFIHLLPFFKEFDAFLEECLSQKEILSDEDLTMVEVSLQWRDRFWQVCTCPVDLQQVSLGMLSLHWGWVCRKTVPAIGLLTVQDSIPLALQTVMSQLQECLGHDRAAALVQLALWGAMGHPGPFRTVKVAELVGRCHKVADCLEVTGNKKQLRSCDLERRVVFQATQGSSVGRSLAELLVRLHQLNTEESSETVADVERAIEVIEADLRAHGLLVTSDHVAMETESAPRPAPADLVTRVQMWPLLEHTSLMAELQLVTDLIKLRLLLTTSDSSPVEETLQKVGSFLQYSTTHLPASPLHTALYQIRLQNGNNSTSLVKLLTEQLSSLVMQFHNRCWTSTVTSDITQWLSWKPRDTSAESEEEPQQSLIDIPGSLKGPAALLSSLHTPAVFHVLWEGGSQAGPIQLPSVALGQCQEKLQQLQRLSQHLWSNACSLTDPGHQFWISDRRYLYLCTAQLLRALTAVIPTERQPEWVYIVTDVVMATEKPSSPVVDRARKILTDLVQDDPSSQAGWKEHTTQNLQIPRSTLNLLTTCLQSLDDMGYQDIREQGREVLQFRRECGGTWVHLGLLQVQLLAPQGPVDPAEKQAVKLGYVREEIRTLETELKVRNMSSQLLTGRPLDLTKVGLQSQHPRLGFLVARLESLRKHEKELATRVAARPTPSQFDAILRDVCHYQTSVGSQDTVMALLNGLTNCGEGKLRKGQQNKLRSLLSQEQAWQMSQQQFLRHMQRDYPMYTDLLTPFLSGINQMIHGMRLTASAVYISLQRSSLDLTPSPTLKLQTPEDLIRCLGKFPHVSTEFPTLLDLARVLCSPEAATMAKNVVKLQTAEEMQHSDKAVESLLHSALLLVRNHSLQTGQLTGTTLQLLRHILQSYVLQWQEGREQDKEKEQEEASLYKWKSKTHGDSLTEEQQEEREIRQQFPGYEEAFGDITAEPTLGDDDDDDSSKTSQEIPAPVHDGKLSHDVVLQICEVHHSLYSGLTRALWLDVDRELTAVNHVEPFLIGYQTAAELSRPLLGQLDCRLDGDLVGGHIVVSSLVQGKLKVLETGAEDSKTTPQQSRQYDIYHDPNISEVLQCRTLLTGVTVRTEELLAQWPDHPTLKQIVQLVERLLSFPVTSPLMKFLTGLELLLKKAQEWENNASREVSMTTQLEAIMQMIIQWRKLELRCWSHCLDTCTQHATETARTKWWFHLYQLIESQLFPEASSSANSDEAAQTSTSEFVSSLKQFLEGSSLGEFPARLQMVHDFHCHAAAVAANQQQAVVANVLWNLHCYYQQFVPTVQDTIKDLRAPVEKELKGFVKIARWSDLNFWAMKDSVEKTRRTLHKYIRKFKESLGKLASSVMTTNILETDESVKQVEEAKQDVIPVSNFVAPEVLQVYFQLTTGLSGDLTSDLGSLQPRLPSLFLRMRRLCRQIMDKAPYPALISTVDEFAGEIAAGIKELQTLDVSKTSDKDKQKSEVKHIQLRKRKALSELFKYLGTIGLSYRKGLGCLATSDLNEALLTPAMDMSATCAQVVGGAPDSTRLCLAWDGCEKHFWRCVSRRAAMHAAMATPAKDLGGANIDRCKGFSEHLLTVMLAQRRHLADMLGKWAWLRMMLSSLESLHPTLQEGTMKPTLPPQHQTVTWLQTLKTLLDRCASCLDQFSILLQACPAAPDGNILQPPSPLPAEKLPPSAMMRFGDSGHQDCCNRLKECVSIIQDLKTKVDLKTLELDTQLVSWEVFGLVDSGFQSLTSLQSSLLCIEAQFSTKDSTIGSSVGDGNTEFSTRHSSKEISTRDSANGTGLADCLTQLRVVLTERCAEFGQWKSTTVVAKSVGGDPGSNVDSCVEGFTEERDSAVTALLLAVQQLFKSVTKQETEEVPETEEMEEDLSSHLQEGLVTKLLEQGLQEDCTTLNMGRVQDSVAALVARVRNVQDQDNKKDADACVSLLLNLVPMLHQYVAMTTYYLTLRLTSHRATCKLLSILLGLFSDLASKGFCLPAEFSDELGGEGATQFEDIEGGGIGEGEGAKDVSDQIENEDQLQEAQKPDQEREDQDPDQQPDVQDEQNAIEMSDDFDGKMHNLEPEEGENSDSDEDEADENELDKQIGDVDGEGAEKLDEKLWGDDMEEEEQPESEKEEHGKGDEKEEDSKIVAKDDNKEEGQDKDKKDDRQKKSEEEEGEGEDDVQPHDLEELDEREYDENEVDPYHGDDQAPPPEPEVIDLPEDMELDKEEGEEDTEGKDEMDVENEDVEKDIKEGEKEEDEEMQEGESKMEEEEAQGEIEQDESKDMDSKDTEQTENDEQGEEEKEEEEEEDAKEGRKEDVAMPTDVEDQDEDEGQPDGEKGQHPEDHPDVDNSVEDQEGEEEEKMTAEKFGAAQASQEAIQNQDAPPDSTADPASKEDQQDKGVGMTPSEQDGGESGMTSSTVAPSDSRKRQQPSKRKPGQSDIDRSLGSHEDTVHKRLRTMESAGEPQNKERETKDESADMYEHVKDAESSYDTQTLDAATREQTESQQPPVLTDSEGEEEEEREMELEDLLKDAAEKEDEHKGKALPSSVLHPQPVDQDKTEGTEGDGEGGEDKDDTQGGGEEEKKEKERRLESTIHTVREMDAQTGQPPASTADLEELRSQLEHQLVDLRQKPQASAEETRQAVEAWQGYEMLTSGLARELCEQLRLILEPSQATKLRGDYRTGKRLNMRKVIPYIASQFRKDKIWLRRTKPSKRQYQIMLAVDDSLSMADNHSQQLAFESLAVMSNALTWLEAGELGVCSFGEEVQLLHPFEEQFSSQSGARILQRFTFQQNKTQIAQLLESMTAIMALSRRRLHSVSAPETAQLLLVVSDGRGLFLEGSDKVKAAVRAAREANIFLVFVVIDNPDNKDSILDIKVPIFKGPGEMPEIRPYMDYFPFPYYLILRDINALPPTLSDALRQWFELVTAGDL